MKSLFAGLITLLSASAAFGATLDVCGTCLYTTIQNAIDHSGSGDLIRVAQGTYTEDLYIPTSSFNIVFQGGYNPTFTSRNGETIVNGKFQFSSSSASSVTIDRFTITNASSQAIYAYGTTTDLTVTNCKIHNAVSYGIYGYDPGNITIDGSEIYSNVGGIGIQRLTLSKTMTITNNQIYSNNCSNCAGLYMAGMTSSDLIQGNVIYDNHDGISLLLLNSSIAPIIANNRIYQNASYGMILSHGSPMVKNNLIYKNSVSGIYYYSVDSPQFLNNLFASNGPYGSGLRLSIGSGAPVIKNNIFYDEFHGLYLDSNLSPTPASVDHNAFFQDQLLDYRDLRTGYEELPGSYNDLNHFSYTNSNLSIDPRFVDAANDDYSLQSDSFLIDEGDPTSDFSGEPAPNGSRINIGPLGNTGSANPSPTAPTISNFLVSQSGSDIALEFDTNTASRDLWLQLEYFDGSAYHIIPPTSISGTSYRVGYLSGRVTSGAGQSLIWANAEAVFGTGSFSTRIRATLSHGSSSAVGVSSDFNLTFPYSAPTATPTPTLTPTPTPSETPIPSATPSASPSFTPSPTQTHTPSPTGSPTPSPNPPRIKVQPVLLRVGSALKLRAKLKDKDSSIVRVSGYVRSRIASLKTKRVILKTVTVPMPALKTSVLNFGRNNLKRGKWEYCLVATDDTMLSTARSCAELIVELKRTK